MVSGEPKANEEPRAAWYKERASGWSRLHPLGIGNTRIRKRHFHLFLLQVPVHGSLIKVQPAGRSPSTWLTRLHLDSSKTKDGLLAERRLIGGTMDYWRTNICDVGLPMSRRFADTMVTSLPTWDQVCVVTILDNGHSLHIKDSNRIRGPTSGFDPRLWYCIFKTSMLDESDPQ